ncbi:MAG: nucleotidyltransferase domain-containing protein [Symbiobacteriaceae bacterium]|nr:nucleotidyltransferase domain-containing protein [Symbiobacteriaceae bacterium]
MTQREKHQAALDSFVAQVKDDPNVMVLLLAGSLSYGEVWAKSDIDLTMLVRDGSISQNLTLVVDSDGIDIVLTLEELSRFKGRIQSWVGGDYTHNYFAKGTVIFSRDASFASFFNDARRLGKEDAILAFLSRGSDLIHQMHRVEKWVTIYGDLLYAQRFLQWCCTEVAHMVLLQHGETPTRESIRRALELEPLLMQELYIIPSTTFMSKEELLHSLQIINDYLTLHQKWWSSPILQLLSDGEIKTESHICKYLRIPSGMLGWLAEKGVIDRLVEPSRLFKKSKTVVEEIAYVFVGNPPAELRA